MGRSLTVWYCTQPFLQAVRVFLVDVMHDRTSYVPEWARSETDLFASKDTSSSAPMLVQLSPLPIVGKP